MNSVLIRLRPTFCNFTKKETPSQTFSRTFLKLLKLLFYRRQNSRVSGQLPLSKIVPRLGLGFGLGLWLELRLGGNFPRGQRS